MTVMICQTSQMGSAAVDTAGQQSCDTANDFVFAHIDFYEPVSKGHIHVIQLIITGDALQMSCG